MADQRLTAGLTAWLRDSDIPPPDARMSASRVMAGVETTVRLGRFWPPARLAPAVDPAPALRVHGPGNHSDEDTTGQELNESPAAQLKRRCGATRKLIEAHARFLFPNRVNHRGVPYSATSASARRTASMILV